MTADPVTTKNESTLDLLDFTIPDEPGVTETIFARAAQLLHELQAGTHGPFDAGLAENAALGQILMPPPPPRMTDVRKAFNTIMKLQRLTQSALPALICVPTDHYLKSDGHKPMPDDKADTIRARVLVVCIGLAQKGFQAHIIINAARAARHVIAGRAPKVAKALPDFSQPIASLNSALTLAHENNIDTPIKNQIHHLYYAFIKFHPEAKKEPSRNRGSRTHPPSKCARPEALAPEGYEVEELFDPTTETGSVASAESQHDQPKSTRAFRIKLTHPERYRHELACSANRSSKALTAIMMRETLAPCSADLLTQHMVAELVRRCYPTAIKGCVGSILLLVSLFWGRPVSMLARLHRTAGNIGRLKPTQRLLFRNGRSQLQHRLSLPAHGAKKYAALIDRENAAFLLDLPDTLSKAFSKFRNSDASEFEAAAEKRLKQLRKHVRGGLTARRIANHFYVHLHHSGCDPTLSAILCGHDAKQRAGIYYRSTSTQKLSIIHREYGQQLLSAAQIADTWKQTSKTSARAGSALQVKKPLLHRMFKLLRREIKHESQNPQRSPARLHNTFALYTYKVLMAATGHRPVNSPFERVTDICHASGEIFLSDKENRNTASATIAVLPNLAKQQWLLYGNHLETLASSFRFLQPKVARYIDKALAGNAQQFFFILEDRVSDIHGGGGSTTEYRIAAATTQRIDSMLRQIWPAPLNWARHTVSSSLADLDVPSELIDIWMRHDDFGRDALGRHSGLSMHHKREVAEKVNTLLQTDFGIQTVSA